VFYSLQFEAQILSETFLDKQKVKTIGMVKSKCLNLEVIKLHVYENKV